MTTRDGRLGAEAAGLYSVLLLEAGGPTQQSLGRGKHAEGRWSKSTIFDVPLSWVQILFDHRWNKQFAWAPGL